jgi:hypothetical protein
MTSEDLKELASVFRAESANVGGPVQASLQRIATMLDEKAAACALSEIKVTLHYDPFLKALDAIEALDVGEDADVKLPTEPDELESLDQ